jgi:hypothetical protein
MPGHATSYEISKKIRVLQDRKEMRCDPKNNQKVIKCLQDYFDKNLDCVLPWSPNIQGQELIYHTHFQYFKFTPFRQAGM